MKAIVVGGGLVGSSLAAKLAGDGHDVVVVTGDKDLAQVLEPGVRLLDLAKNDLWGADQVPARLGVRAEQVPDLLALMGDSSDNIPGVKGVGKVAAAALLQHFEDLDAIYRGLDTVATLPLRGAKSLRKKLEEHEAMARLSRELATVRFDAPVEAEPEDLVYHGADGASLDAFAETWGLGRVAERVPRRD